MDKLTNAIEKIESRFYKALASCSDNDLVVFAKYITHPKHKGRGLLKMEYDILRKEIIRRKLQGRFKAVVIEYDEP